MPFGRGFGFRGWSPPWPYVGRGRGGFPRRWAYGANWGASYANPYEYGAYPYSADPYSSNPYGGYPYGASPYEWGDPYGFPATPDVYGIDYPPYAQMSPGYPHTLNPWGSPYSPPQESPRMTGEGEEEWLKNQAELIRQGIDQIKSRISELEKE